MWANALQLLIPKQDSRFYQLCITVSYCFFQAQYAMLIDIAHNVVLYTEPKKKVGGSFHLLKVRVAVISDFKLF